MIYERNLRLIERNDGAVEVEFMKYPRHGLPHYTRRLLTDKEVNKAKNIIINKDKHDIDIFCHSIV